MTNTRISKEGDAEVPTPENQHQPPKKRFLERTRQRIMEKWDEEGRPGLFELHYYYIPLAAITLASAVNVSDEVFETHIADHLAQVQVHEDANFVEKSLEEVAREIGKLAGGDTSP